MKKAKKSLRQ